MISSSFVVAVVILVVGLGRTLLLVLFILPFRSFVMLDLASIIIIRFPVTISSLLYRVCSFLSFFKSVNDLKYNHHRSVVGEKDARDEMNDERTVIIVSVYQHIVENSN